MKKSFVTILASFILFATPIMAADKVVVVPLFSKTATKIEGSVFRWQVFSTYPNNMGWVMNNDSSLHGGVNPSSWTDFNSRAVNMSSNSEVLRTLLTRKGYGGANAMVFSDVYHQYSSTNGKVVVVLFRIKNTTGNAINWTPYFYYTCSNVWGERAGVAINGSEVWNSGTTNCTQSSTGSIVISVPANQTSTVIFTSPSTYDFTPTASFYVRYVNLTFYNNSLSLPIGLEYVDDLDSIQGNLW